MRLIYGTDESPELGSTPCSSIEEGVAAAKREYLAYLAIKGYSEESSGVFAWDGQAPYSVGGRAYMIVTE